MRLLYTTSIAVKRILVCRKKVEGLVWSNMESVKKDRRKRTTLHAPSEEVFDGWMVNAVTPAIDPLPLLPLSPSSLHHSSILPP